MQQYSRSLFCTSTCVIFLLNSSSFSMDTQSKLKITPELHVDKQFILHGPVTVHETIPHDIIGTTSEQMKHYTPLLYRKKRTHNTLFDSAKRTNLQKMWILKFDLSGRTLQPYRWRWSLCYLYSAPCGVVWVQFASHFAIQCSLRCSVSTVCIAFCYTVQPAV